MWKEIIRRNILAAACEQYKQYSAFVHELSVWVWFSVKLVSIIHETLPEHWPKGQISAGKSLLFFEALPRVAFAVSRIVFES